MKIHRILFGLADLLKNVNKTVKIRMYLYTFTSIQGSFQDKDRQYSE